MIDERVGEALAAIDGAVIDPAAVRALTALATTATDRRA